MLFHFLLLLIPGFPLKIILYEFFFIIFYAKLKRNTQHQNIKSTKAHQIHQKNEHTTTTTTTKKMRREKQQNHLHSQLPKQ